MGRYLDGIAGMSCGGGPELTVMSSHLESFIRSEQNSSVERVAQMKDSLRVMDALVRPAWPPSGACHLPSPSALATI